MQTPVILAPAVKTPAPGQGNFKEISYLKVEAGESISVQFQNLYSFFSFLLYYQICNFRIYIPFLAFFFTIKNTYFGACLNNVL